MRVLVLLGGDSPEREVSLRSGRAVLSAISNSMHIASFYDPAEGLEGLVKAVNNIDVVLPILHGKNGEDGVIQEQLEGLNVLFLGADSKSSKLSSDKVKTHEALEKAGVGMPTYEVVDSVSFVSSKLAKKPYVLKPIDGGSSVDMVISRSLRVEDKEASQALLKKYPKMIIEELIIGVEITVPVLGNDALPVIAIIPPEGGEFDYENKYNGKTEEICPIPDELVSRQIQKKAQEIALKVQTALGVRHLSRTDMIVRPNGDIIILELNTIPGMTEQSLYPKAAGVAGISMEELVERFINMTKESD